MLHYAKVREEKPLEEEMETNWSSVCLVLLERETKNVLAHIAGFAQAERFLSRKSSKHTPNLRGNSKQVTS